MTGRRSVRVQRLGAGRANQRVTRLLAYSPTAAHRTAWRERAEAGGRACEPEGFTRLLAYSPTAAYRTAWRGRM
eukprot:scaffold75364_cov57-Phaeocystis_antarctica.AAC.2